MFDYENKGFNHKECLEQALLLKKVMFKTEAVKHGRGRKAFVTQEYVYNTEEDQSIRLKILDTIKHYETKLEKLPNQNNK